MYVTQLYFCCFKVTEKITFFNTDLFLLSTILILYNPKTVSNLDRYLWSHKSWTKSSRTDPLKNLLIPMPLLMILDRRSVISDASWLIPYQPALWSLIQLLQTPIPPLYHCPYPFNPWFTSSIPIRTPSILEPTPSKSDPAPLIPNIILQITDPPFNPWPRSPRLWSQN